VLLKLKGVNSVTKRLADGTARTYWYAWKGGPALRGEPGTPEFIASYNEACAGKVVPPSGALLTILNQYQGSEDFTGLASSTRRSYAALIARIEKQFTDFPLAALTDRRARGIFKEWRDRIATDSGRRQADYAWTVLLGSCHGHSTVALLPLNRVNVVAGSIADPAGRRYGRPMMKRYSWSALQIICVCR
jgi:hypothetical protein